MLFSVVQNPYISAADLNNDLKTISQWAHQWKMEFNTDPNKQATEMLSDRKNLVRFILLFLSMTPKTNFSCSKSMKKLLKKV